MSSCTPQTPIKLALVGCGRISQAHLSAMDSRPELFTLSATCDVTLEAAQHVAEKYGAHAYTEIDDLLREADVDAVLIASPNKCHFEQALKAIQAKKHVLIEKPLAETSEQAQVLHQAAEEAGLVLAAGHTFRHGDATRELMKRMSDFGKLLSVEVTQCVFWDGPQAPWWAARSPEEGLILSMFAPHSLDFVQLVMGDDEPTSLHAEAARHQSGWQGEDEAMMIFSYPNRRIASVHISYNQPYVLDRKTLFFDQGIAEIHDGEWLYWNGKVLVEPPPGRVSDPHSMGKRDLSSFFENQLEEFAKACYKQPNMCPTGRDAKRLIDTLDKVRSCVRANSASAIDPPL